MSNLNLENNLIENVTFFYPKIKQAVLKYQSQTDKEFSVTVQVDKATKTLWNKTFQKQKCKELEYDDFCEKYGVEYAIGNEEQYLLTLKKPANYKDKETGQLKDIPDAYRPRALIDDGNGELEDVTFTKLIGNGSKGVVQYEVNSNDYGTFAKLLAIRVDELVVVEQGDSAGKFNVLGKVKSLAENPNANSKAQETPVVTDDSQENEDDQW